MNQTRVARSILRVLNNAHQPLSRHEIARSLGKRYLMRHDIVVLNKLMDIDLVAGVKRARWEVIDERMAYRSFGNMRPDISKDISNGSMAWWYEITEAGAQVIRQADRWMERPATVPKQPRQSALAINDQRSTINLGNQNSRSTINDQRLHFDFDFDDIMIDLDSPGEETEASEQPGEESIIDRVMNKLEWFLNQK